MWSSPSSTSAWANSFAAAPASRDGTAARAYDEGVDYVLHVKDQVLTPAQVAAKINAYRQAGTTFEDTVPAS